MLQVEHGRLTMALAEEDLPLVASMAKGGDYSLGLDMGGGGGVQDMFDGNAYRATATAYDHDAAREARPRPPSHTHAPLVGTRGTRVLRPAAG